MALPKTADSLDTARPAARPTMLWKPTIRWPRRYSPWWIAAYSVGAGLAALAVIIFSVSGLVGGFIAGVAFAAVFELLDRAFTSLGTPPRSSKD